MLPAQKQYVRSNELDKVRVVRARRMRLLEIAMVGGSRMYICRKASRVCKWKEVICIREILQPESKVERKVRYRT